MKNILCYIRHSAKLIDGEMEWYECRRCGEKCTKHGKNLFAYTTLRAWYTLCGITANEWNKKNIPMPKEVIRRLEKLKRYSTLSCIMRIFSFRKPYFDKTAFKRAKEWIFKY